MANNNMETGIETMFKGMRELMNTKTVVGEPMQVGEATIIPLVDVSWGMGSGGVSKEQKETGAGGMGAKVSPAAVLIIQNGITKLVNVRNQDIVNKALDLVPDLINRFTSKDEISSEAVEAANDIVNDKQQ